MQTENNNKKNIRNAALPDRKNFFLWGIFMAVLAVLTIIAVLLYRNTRRGLDAGAGNSSRDTDYRYHFAMIVSEDNDEFWTSVYAGAAAAGEKNGAYIELLGDDLTENYNEETLMDLAIAEKVDGILIENDGSASIAEKINDAASAGIPVVTLLRDCSESGRISYVGISYFNLGQQYAEQISDLIEYKRENGDADKERWRVMLLMDDNTLDSSRTIVYSTIQENFSEREDLASCVDLETMKVDESIPFEAEEQIRNIFVSEQELPDIIVCMDETSSACVYQELVDYNQVGNVEQIAYSTGAAILSGIEKNVIFSTAGIDTTQMGTYGAEALTEYLETGHASDYYSVDTFIVNRSNITEYTGGEADEEQN